MNDPLMVALQAWDVISVRLLNCLATETMPGNPISTVAGVPIERMRLSDLARREPQEILRIPNLGRTCFRELGLVMELYGWTMNGVSAVRSDRWRAFWPGGHEKWLGQMEADREKRRALFDRDVRMLTLRDVDRLPFREIGRRFGMSDAMAQNRVQNVRKRLAVRKLYPLS